MENQGSVTQLLWKQEAEAEVTSSVLPCEITEQHQYQEQQEQTNLAVRLQQLKRDDNNWFWTFF